jgi:hypothetical protein
MNLIKRESRLEEAAGQGHLQKLQGDSAAAAYKTTQATRHDAWTLEPEKEARYCGSRFIDLPIA